MPKTNDFTIQKMQTDLLDEKRFQDACDSVIASFQGQKGIGTLQEKSVHAVLKSYYEPESRYTEVPIGAYVADICRDGEIMEIQSKSFYVMKQKLSAFLKEYEVTIVYPAALQKYVIWIDPQTGEAAPPRKSSRKGHLYDIVPELYSIREFLSDPHLHFRICLIEMEEYKLLDGYGKDHKCKATKTDRFPTRLAGEFMLNDAHDLLSLLPEELLHPAKTTRPFTSADLKELTGCSMENARILLRLLHLLGLVRLTGKHGRYHSYEIVQNTTQVP